MREAGVREVVAADNDVVDVVVVAVVFVPDVVLVVAVVVVVALGGGPRVQPGELPSQVVVALSLRDTQHGGVGRAARHTRPPRVHRAPPSLRKLLHHVRRL